MTARLLVLSSCAVCVWAQGQWEPRAPYPVALTEISGAEAGGKLYSLCGITPQGSISAMHVYDPVADTWEEAPPVPVSGGLDHCNVASVGGKVYLLGALRFGTGAIEGGTWMFDPVTRQWTRLGAMLTPRGASGVAVIGTRIYVAGGIAAGSRIVPAFEVFDTAAAEWVRLADMPTARDHLTAQAVGGRFYAIAGRNGGITAVQGPTEEYDPVANAWRTRAPIPVIRGGLASGVIGGRIVVFGGEGNRPQSFFENHVYDPQADTWQALAPMPTPRHGLYGITFAGRIFVAGGGPQPGATFSTAHEVFYLPPAEPPTIEGPRQSASYVGDLTAGALVSVFGSRLAFGEQRAARFPAPSSMNAVRVTVSGAAMPLLYVSPGQVNFHLPYSMAAGPVRITVTNAGSESNVHEGVIQTAPAPGVFSLDGSGRGQGAILIAGTGLIARATRDAFSRAPRRGVEAIEIYATGLGRVDNPPEAGQPSPSMPVARTVETPVVVVGGVQAEVLFSGLAPGALGLYQINATVPSGAPVGIAVPVAVRMGGRQSNEVTIAVVE